MSIEQNLTRIADALEALVNKLDHIGQAATSTSTPAPKKTPAAPAPKETPAPPAPKETPAPPAANDTAADGASTAGTTANAVAVPPPPPASPVTADPTTQSPVNTPAAADQATPPPVVAMTPEELNTALVAEFQRLGKRDPIDKVMQSEPFGVQSVLDLKPEQYGDLINAVKAINV